jgi:hypothetical protein
MWNRDAVAVHRGDRNALVCNLCQHLAWVRYKRVITVSSWGTRGEAGFLFLQAKSTETTSESQQQQILLRGVESELVV